MASVSGQPAPFVEAPAFPVDSSSRDAKEADTRSEEEDGSESAAGLVLAGGAVALGHGIELGSETGVDAPMTAAFRPVLP